MSYTPSLLDLSSCFVTLDDNSTVTIKSLANNNITHGGTINGNLTVTGKLTATTPESTDDSTNVATTAFVNSYATKLVANSTYENLPSIPTIGMMYLVTNGLKPGESSGSGTGEIGRAHV